MKRTSPSPKAPQSHPAISFGKVGVLLVNLGTPDKADSPSVRRYLQEFLSDRRVVDWPRPVWLPILHGIILNTRPSKTARLYASIWRDDSNESPLRYYTRRQAEEVRSRLGDEVLVDWAMRYGNPSIPDRLDALQSAGCDRIVIVPLYPQYSSSTTGTVVDEVGRFLKGKMWQPSIRIAPPFYDAPGYIDSLASTIGTDLPSKPEQIILSFHGVPERYLTSGDPYHCHCQVTARLMREKMGWSEDYAPLGFQSKFGPEKWLEPSTESLVIKAAEAGKKHIAIMAPAFVADCIETLEEIAMGLSETFIEHGGDTLTAIPCLNDHPVFMDYLGRHVRTELGGWV